MIEVPTWVFSTIVGLTFVVGVCVGWFGPFEDDDEGRVS